MTTTTQDAIAAFLAKGGAIRKVEAGASNGMTNRDWYLAARDGNSPNIGEKLNSLIEERHVQGGVVYNGLGEVIGKEF